LPAPAVYFTTKQTIVYVHKNLQNIVAFVLDICRVRFRYLSCSFQISVVFVSDICEFRFRYHKKLQPLCFYFIVLERCLFW